MLTALRYGLPGVLVFAGVCLLCFADESIRYEGFGLCAGAGIALAVFAQLIRLNTSGAHDRDEEEAARRFLTEHGHWPDEPPPAD
jgi:hypothetical protein